MLAEFIYKTPLITKPITQHNPMPVSSICIPENVVYNAQCTVFCNPVLAPSLDTHRMFHIMFIILSTKITNEFPSCRNRKHYYSHVMTIFRSLFSLFFITVFTSNQGTTFHTNKTKRKTDAFCYADL